MENKYNITEKDAICTAIARGIDFWINEVGDKINQYQHSVDRERDIFKVVHKCFEEGKKKVEKLNGATPKWIVSVLYNEGYGKQCMEVGPFEVETKEKAKKLCEEKLTEMFSASPNVDIIDLKIKRYSH